MQHSRLDNIVSMLVGQSVHCVHVGETHGRILSLDGAAPLAPAEDVRDISAVPFGSSAVLLLTTMRSLELCRRLVGEILAVAEQQPPPILVLKLRESDEALGAGFLEESRLILEAGADDVLIEPAILADLPGALALSIAGSESRQEQLREARRQASGQEGGGLFWQSVHWIFEGFPEMDEHLTGVVQPGAKLGQHVLGERLSAGAFGEVFRATLAGQGANAEEEMLRVVWKDCVLSLAAIEGLWREVILLRKLGRHPHVCNLSGIVHGRDCLCVSMEYVGARHLAAVLQSKPSGEMELLEANRFVQQISGALAWLHCQLIVHRDIKPENVLVSDDGSVAKLVDFTAAGDVDECRTEQVGTMPFVPPESLRGEFRDATSNDVWALGVLLFECLAGVGSFTTSLGLPNPLFFPEPWCADVLADYLSDSQRLISHVEAARGTPMSPGVSALLLGVLHLDASSRWSAARAEAHVSQIIAEVRVK